jgi:hypothetical protein
VGGTSPIETYLDKFNLSFGRPFSQAAALITREEKGYNQERNGNVLATLHSDSESNGDTRGNVCGVRWRFIRDTVPRSSLRSLG